MTSSTQLHHCIYCSAQLWAQEHRFQSPRTVPLKLCTERSSPAFLCFVWVFGQHKEKQLRKKWAVGGGYKRPGGKKEKRKKKEAWGEESFCLFRSTVKHERTKARCPEHKAWLSDCVDTTLHWDLVIRVEPQHPRDLFPLRKALDSECPSRCFSQGHEVGETLRSAGIPAWTVGLAICSLLCP